MNSSKQLKLGAIISYGVILFNIIAGLLYTPWMINQIGRADYGLYILVTTFLAYFVVDYGMWMSVNKLLSQYRAEENKQKIDETISVATRIYLAIDVVILVVLSIVYLNIDSIFNNLSSSDIDKFKTIFIIAGISSVLNFPFAFVRGIMYSHEYLYQNRLFELGAKVGLILATVLALLLNGGLYWLVVVYATVPLVRNLWICGFLYSKGIRLNLSYWNKSIAVSIFAISGWLLLIVIAELFVNNISPTIISIRNSIEEVSIFAIGTTIYGYVYSISNSVAGLFLPRIERLKHNDQVQELDSFTLKVGRIQLLITGFIIFGIFSSGSLFIEGWLGTSFSDSYIVASLLVVSGLISNAQQVESSHLFSVNKVYYRAIFMTLTALCSVALSYILTPEYGAIGAAIAISISNFIFMNIGMNIIYMIVLDFRIGKFLKMLVKFVLTFSVALVITKLLEIYVYNNIIATLNVWWQFIIVAVTYSVLFISLSWTLLMNNYEKSLVTGALASLKNKF